MQAGICFAAFCLAYIASKCYCWYLNDRRKIDADQTLHNGKILVAGTV